MNKNKIKQLLLLRYMFYISTSSSIQNTVDTLKKNNFPLSKSKHDRFEGKISSEGFYLLYKQEFGRTGGVVLKGIIEEEKGNAKIYAQIRPHFTNIVLAVVVILGLSLGGLHYSNSLFEVLIRIPWFTLIAYLIFLPIYHSEAKDAQSKMEKLFK